jgi:hypothetical protein
MGEAERRGPIAQNPANVRRGKKANEAEVEKFIEERGVALRICWWCGHFAGSNPRCQECGE